jgi:general secretion pathway protein J
MIAAGCASMLMQSVDSQRSISSAHEALRDLQTTRALLAGDLMQAAPRAVRSAEGSRRPEFLGGDEDIGLAFTRAAAEPDPNAGAVTTLLYVEYAVHDGALVRRTRAYPDALPDSAPLERVVMRDVSSARFSFYDGVSWGEGWASAGYGGALPRAVALEVETRRYGKVRILTLVGLGR